MKARPCPLVVESLEDRLVPATVAYGDFNNDGLIDYAQLTSPRAITVRLANADGSYTASATLTAPKAKPMQHVLVYDALEDGILDLAGQGSKKSGRRTEVYYHSWLGKGDGSFALAPNWP
jgi:hypothetical protein